MRFPLIAVATAATLALGACAAMGVSTVGQKYPLYRTAHNNYALNGRDVFVIVEGGGYGLDKATFRQTVLDTMQRYRGGMNTRFTNNSQVNYNSDYKVVMLFNGPTSAQPDDLCGRPEQFAAITPGAGADTHVLAAFCRYDAPLTAVNGRAAGVSGVGDARFASLIQQTMVDLFPPTDDRPQKDSDDSGSDIP